jgi:hypothetical protein
MLQVSLLSPWKLWWKNNMIHEELHLLLCKFHCHAPYLSTIDMQTALEFFHGGHLVKGGHAFSRRLSKPLGINKFEV